MTKYHAHQSRGLSDKAGGPARAVQTCHFCDANATSNLVLAELRDDGTPTGNWQTVPVCQEHVQQAVVEMDGKRYRAEPPH